MRRQHHIAAALAYLTALMVAALLVLMAWQLPASLNAANNTDQVRQGNELAACRSQVRATVDTAIGGVLAAKSRLDLLTSAGFEASIRQDTAALQTVVDRAAGARAEVDAAVEDLDAATAAYRAAVRESIDHPRRFLANCAGS